MLVLGLKRMALRKSRGSITARPNPIETSDYSGYGATTLLWTSFGTEKVEVHVGSPDGQLFSSSGPSGRQVTGEWVHDGMAFYLQDVSGGLPLTLANTLGTVIVGVVPSKTLRATTQLTG